MLITKEAANEATILWYIESRSLKRFLVSLPAFVLKERNKGEKRK
jgi:hypothetical protein